MSYACQHTKVYSQVGTKLFINVTSRYSLQHAEIHCPPDSTDCYVHGYEVQEMLNYADIYAVHPFSLTYDYVGCDTDLECLPDISLERPTFFCNGSNDESTFCGLTRSASMIGTGWKCHEDHYDAICDEILRRTPNPTQFPTATPTTAIPTFSPTHSFDEDKIVYISSTGCDYGICSNPAANYNEYCAKNEFMSQQPTMYNECCLNQSASTANHALIPSECDEFGVVTIENNITYHSLTANTFPDVLAMYNASNGFYHDTLSADYPSKALCFQVSPNYTCSNPEITVHFENIWYANGRDDWNQEYLNVSYMEPNNFISAQCFGGTSNSASSCGTMLSCLIRQQPSDGPWIQASGVKVFYFKNGPTVFMWCKDGENLYQKPFTPDSYNMNISMSVSCAAPIFEDTTCQSMRYGWDCLHGAIDECADANFTGNGKIKLIGDATYAWNESIVNDNRKLVIAGDGSNQTTLNYNGTDKEIMICEWIQCRITIADLKYVASSTSHTLVFQVSNGGNVKFENVWFELDAQQSVLFDFVNREYSALFESQYVQIIDSTFTDHNDLIFNISKVDHVTIANCTFINNKISFAIANGAVLYLDNVSFINNYGDSIHSMFNIASDSNVTITNSLFDTNEHFYSLIHNDASLVSIQSTSFVSNREMHHILSSSTTDSLSTVLECDLFTNNACYDTHYISVLNGGLYIDLYSLTKRAYHETNAHDIDTASNAIKLTPLLITRNVSFWSTSFYQQQITVFAGSSLSYAQMWPDSHAYIDLMDVYSIGAVGIWGYAKYSDSLCCYPIISFNVSYSIDGIHFTDDHVNNPLFAKQINYIQWAARKNMFPYESRIYFNHSFDARYIRFVIVERLHTSLKRDSWAVEVYGTESEEIYPTPSPIPPIRYPHDPNECLDDGTSITAWYDGYSIDLATNTWLDKIGNTPNRDAEISGSGIDVYNNMSVNPIEELMLNEHPVITGTYQTIIDWPQWIQSSVFTIFNLCKYRVNSTMANRGLILDGKSVSSAFGFYAGRSGVCKINRWITQQQDVFGTDWVLSSAGYNMYRANGQNLVTQNVPQSLGFGREYTVLSINNGISAPSQNSDFACAEIMIFENRILSEHEVECIESYFECKYGLNGTNACTPQPTQSPTSVTLEPSASPTHDPVSESPTISDAPTLSPTEAEKVLLFGHTPNNTDFNALHIESIHPKDVENRVDFMHWGYQNGSIIFEQCEPFDSEYVDQTAFEQIVASKAINTTHSFSQAGEFYDDVLICNDTQICYVECREDVLTCFGSSFLSNITSATFVDCHSESSCAKNNIFISNADEAAILCFGASSCSEAVVSIRNISTQFSLECVEAESCFALHLNISNASPQITVSCYGIASCSNINIFTDTNDINVLMHSFSDNVMIYIPSDYDSVNLVCDPNDAYLSIDGTDFIDSNITNHDINLTSNPSNVSNDTHTYSEMSQITSCLNVGHTLSAWYDGGSADTFKHMWYDKSGNSHHANIFLYQDIDLDAYGVFDGLDSEHELYLGHGIKSLFGSYQTQIIFNGLLNPSDFTVFNLCKFREEQQAQYARTFLRFSHSVNSGYTDHRNNFGFYWQSPINNYSWQFSVTQKDRFRANFNDMLSESASSINIGSNNQLVINAGQYYEHGWYAANFACAEIMVFDGDSSLDSDEILCLEEYQRRKYPIYNDSNSTSVPTKEPTKDPRKSDRIYDIDPVLESKTKELFGGGMPCQQVTFSFHSLDRVDCDVRYEFFATAAVLNELQYLEGEMQCYPGIYVSELTDYTCFGTDEPTNDPTMDPTADPTNDPTTDPTADPTKDPTIDPTVDPTLDPTSDPTNDPTTDPTADPTKDPTIDPTVDPTVDPTEDPSNDPTTDPTADPTIDPTQDPTTDPTNEPTAAPSNAPSIAPSLAPTKSPSNAPSLVPTESPSNAPSLSPTVSPTQPPSNAPSNAPSVAPSFAPTESPSVAPSLSPSNDPSNAPSFSPTTSPTQPPSIAPTQPPSTAPTGIPSQPPSIAPSNAPSVAPSLAPSNIPSNAPSFPPSNAPSNAPSAAPSVTPTQPPSNAPTQPPSAAPTRLPTIDIDEAYDTAISIVYRVRSLSESNIYWIVENVMEFIDAVQEMIEQNYFDVETLQFHQFIVMIMEINGQNIEDIKDGDESAELTVYHLDVVYRERPMLLKSEIECADIDSGSIIKASRTKTFVENTQQRIRQYLNNSDLIFDVLSDDDLKALPKSSGEYTDNTAFTITVVVVIFSVCVSFAAFVFNKAPQCRRTDNAKFLAPSLVGLGMYDFVSDINLSVEIFRKTAVSLGNIYSWIGFANVFFIVVPFASNIWYAMRITRQRTIQNNPSARAYFGKHLEQFILACVVTSGTYPVLSLVSSRIFGLEFFETGLLSSELHELSKIKIRSTIFLENVPQLLIQILYSAMVGIQPATQLAFIGSSLSVIASVVIYKAQKEQSEQFILVKYFLRFSRTDAKPLSPKEAETIKWNQGLKEKLGNAFCAVFGISNKSIEIGFCTPIASGCILHIQHAIFHADLQQLKQKLFAQQMVNNIGFDVSVRPDLYAKDRYRICDQEIREVFVNHFLFANFNYNANDFAVKYFEDYECAIDHDDTAPSVARNNVSALQLDAVTRLKTFHMVNSDDDIDEEEGGMIEMAVTKNTKPKHGQRLLEESKDEHDETISKAQFKLIMNEFKGLQSQLEAQRSQLEVQHSQLEVLMSDEDREVIDDAKAEDDLATKKESLDIQNIIQFCDEIEKEIGGTIEVTEGDVSDISEKFESTES